MMCEKFSCVKAAVAAVVLLGATGSSAWAAGGSTTCSGGSIASGVYSSLKISGKCKVDAGPVTVQGNLTVLPGGSLVAQTGGFGVNPPSPNLTVDGNLDVQANGTLVLGCEPIFFTCINDPGPVQTYATRETIGGNLTAEDALAVVVHHAAIGGNVTVSGGGGGLSCFTPTSGYGDVEDVTVGGNLTITGWTSCWLGFFRVAVMQNVNFSGNVTLDPDGNEIANNTILGNLNCSGNNPSPQTGDSVGGPSIVVGKANGQCNSPGLTIP